MPFYCELQFYKLSSFRQTKAKNVGAVSLRGRLFLGMSDMPAHHPLLPCYSKATNTPAHA